VQKPLKCRNLDFFDEAVDSRLWSLFDKIPVITSSSSCGPNKTG
jgi:hypothetical protein